MIRTKPRIALLTVLLVALLTTGTVIGITQAVGDEGGLTPEQAAELVRSLMREESETAKSARPMTPNERLEQIAKENPGFGGRFRDPDDKSIVTVFMTDASKRGIAERAAHASVKDPQSIREVRIVQADYEFTELAEWYRQITKYMWAAVDEVTATSISEETNRIEIGLSDLSARDKVVAVLNELGIPENAVRFEEEVWKPL